MSPGLRASGFLVRSLVLDQFLPSLVGGGEGAAAGESEEVVLSFPFIAVQFRTRA